MTNKGVADTFSLHKCKRAPCKTFADPQLHCNSSKNSETGKEWMWRNRTALALKWHKLSSPSCSQGCHTLVPCSAGQLRWREISSNEMEDKKSGKIATNKEWFLERQAASSAAELMKTEFFSSYFVSCGWILWCEYQLKLFLWLGQP